MNKIDIIVSDLVDKYKTRDPFIICENIDISVINVDLPERINSFSIRILERNIILINKEISKKYKLIACSKELAHILIDGNTDQIHSINYNNLSSNSKSNDNYNYFANLLLSKDEITECNYTPLLFNAI